jgi:hypothetical protein
VRAAAYDATYVLAFMMAGTYLVYSVLILVLRNVFVREEKAGKLATPAADAAAAPAPATAHPVRLSSRLCRCRSVLLPKQVHASVTSLYPPQGPCSFDFALLTIGPCVMTSFMY